MGSKKGSPCRAEGSSGLGRRLAQLTASYLEWLICVDSLIVTVYIHAQIRYGFFRITLQYLSTLKLTPLLFLRGLRSWENTHQPSTQYDTTVSSYCCYFSILLIKLWADVSDGQKILMKCSTLSCLWIIYPLRQDEWRYEGKFTLTEGLKVANWQYITRDRNTKGSRTRCVQRN